MTGGGSGGGSSGGKSSCDACCPTGQCDSQADASKPECAACVACTSSSTETCATASPPLASPAPPPVVLTMTAAGSVDDFDETTTAGLAKKTSLRGSIASAAGVDASAVTLTITAGSVIITATIAVPASSTAAAVQTTLSSTLGTAAAASAALGVTVESVPAIVVAAPPPLPPPPPPPPLLPSTPWTVAAVDKTTAPLNKEQGAPGTPAITGIMFVLGALAGLAMLLLGGYCSCKMWAKRHRKLPQAGGADTSSADETPAVHAVVQCITDKAVTRSVSPRLVAIARSFSPQMYSPLGARARRPSSENLCNGEPLPPDDAAATLGGALRSATRPPSSTAIHYHAEL